VLDIIFYSAHTGLPSYVEMSEAFYEWLAQSQFSQIGESHSVQLGIEGETLELPVVTLNENVRKRLSRFSGI